MTVAVILEEKPEDGITLVNGKPWMTAANGGMMPIELIKPQHKLEDETVRKIIGYARDLNAQLTRFRGHTMTDLGEFDALLEQQYNSKRGGSKGNRTYMSYDGLLKVQVQMADNIDFGPELQVAKGIIDECLNEWSSDARPEIRG